MTATWKGSGEAGAFNTIYLTDTSGVAKVYNGANAVVDTRVTPAQKHERVELTLAKTNGGDSYADYVGTYTIKIKATDHLRIGTSINASGDGDGAVGSYSAASAYSDGVFTGGTEITIGTITIAAGGVSYDSVLDINDEANDAGLYFYVSITNKSNNGTGESTTAGAYGLIGISSAAL